MKLQFNQLPKTVDDLKAISSLEKPEETVALFILTLCNYVEDLKTGIEMIDYLKGPAPLNPYQKQFLEDRLGDKTYLPYSYFKGATPENNYTPSQPYEIEIFEDNRAGEEGYVKLFIQSGGADSRRPITVRQKGNQYFIWEYSSIVSGIRIPAKEDPWS